MTTNTRTITYDDASVRRFMIASIAWGLIGMLVGLICATQLSWWQMNGKFLETLTFGLFKGDGVAYLTFGRLRPLHTNAVIFAFVGNMMFAGIYYSTQRLCKCRTASDILSIIHFWGWQLIILSAAITLPAGFTRGKEYAELIWPINVAVAVIWLVFAVNFFWTLAKRNEPSLYVALWFYIATILTVTMLYVVNHLSLPTSLLHSYPIFGGLQDALVQWWYGHNAVAFFLTTPILGIMYYFLPKAANRPVYSYRLSIIHFWSLVFIYIWAGPHHLLNTALPHWMQMLGMLFSLMLWAPSWGGMLNGLFTLRGAWDKLRTDPVLKFFAAGVTFYGMATFEGPLLAIRPVNALSHYTDWTIGHVHSGALGWNGFMAAGMFYWLAPRLWKTKLWSKTMADFHFWIGLVGILIYVGSMWAAGITQGLMLGTLNPDGISMKYEFVETLKKIQPEYIFRSIGGGFFLFGFILCAINIVMTARSGKPVDDTVEVNVPEKTYDRLALSKGLTNDPVLHILIFILLICLWFFLPPHADKAALGLAVIIAIKAIVDFKKDPKKWDDWHERLLHNYLPFTVLVGIAAAIGGSAQIIPSLIVNTDKNVEGRLQELYTPLELAGRDIYVSEGCYNCHSQMIRTLKPDVMRYGRAGHSDDYSHLGESIYDHPFQWGSKRTGPDLAREGGDLVKGSDLMRSGKRDNKWHWFHFRNPRWANEDSNMPSYAHLYEAKTDFKALPSKIKALRNLGVPYPYPAMTKDDIDEKAREQAMEIAKSLFEGGTPVSYDGMPKATSAELVNTFSERQIIALIAYIQKIGAYHEVNHDGPVEPKTLDPDSYRRASTPTDADSKKTTQIGN
ncbi:cytochrome-c oxidase, cbb3-type subunit I [Luteolibacter pohnpeiensis]|uniref:cytochrome-c oxidase n=1 Tax=Luteolibacter pohnpeiensis TaxID=454153 RepID=A0A934S794_9BACT|nr:cytochrome-c oxidase, cbb3-type subunit I [Luteolibacter pohnpeiensis]MBK1882106.1 cytochrome-c oxidase, cbb3-type subunit I [Luteolibacter pohnpeiensis]